MGISYLSTCPMTSGILVKLDEGAYQAESCWREFHLEND